MTTGFPRLDAMLGGGFPEGLTVIACHGFHALDRWLQGLAESPSSAPRVVWSSDPRRAAAERQDAVRNGRFNVLVREASKEGLPPREDVRVADTVLLASASPGGIVLTVHKNAVGEQSAVRFTYSNGVLTEAGAADVEDSENER